MYDGTLTGAATITGDIDLGSRKVILFVKNADLLVNGNIKLNNGTGFFMVITNQNISIPETVGDLFPEDDITPNLEGIFVADGNINTGTSGVNLDTLRLHIRGSLVADNIKLQRDLTDNSLTAGDLVEYAPDLFFNFPRRLSRRRLLWQEVAP
jgi:hypothetical protein